MNEFKVGDKVRIKEDASYGLDITRVSFEEAGRVGVVEAVGDSVMHGGEYVVVHTPDQSAWEYFKAEELKRIEDTP